MKRAMAALQSVNKRDNSGINIMNGDNAICGGGRNTGCHNDIMFEELRVVEWKWHNSIDLNDKVSQLFFLLK